MSAPEAPTIREAVRLARELDAAGWTNRLSLDEPFAMAFEGEEVRWYGAVHGAREDGRGLLLARGTAGLGFLRRLAESEELAPDERRRLHVLGFEVVGIGAVPDERRDVLRRAGVVSDDVADLFEEHRGRAPAFPDRAGLRRIVTATRAVIAALGDPALDATAPRTAGRIPTIHVSGDPRAPDVRVTVEDDGDPGGATLVPPRISPDLLDEPRGDGRWLAIVLPAEDPDEHRPFELRVFDRDERFTLGESPLPRRDADLAARELLRGAWSDPVPVGLPAAIATDDAALLEAARPALEAAGVRCELVTTDAALREVLDVLTRERTELQAELDRLRRGETSATVRDRLDDAVRDRLGAAGLPDDASWPAYFGPDWAEIGDGSQDDEAMDDWLAFEHRRTPGAPTLAERMLRSDDIEDDVRALLAARAAAVPSLWRVLSVDEDAGTLELADVFTGERVVAEHPDLAAQATVGCVAGFRVADVAPRAVAWNTAPVFAEEDLPGVLAELGATEGSGVRPPAPAFGRLWILRSDRRHAGHGDACDCGDHVA